MSILEILSRHGRAAVLGIGVAFLASQLPTSAATLVHRYSFNSDTVQGTPLDNGDGTYQLYVTNVTDLVGGTAWDGTLPNYGVFTNIAAGTPNVTNGTVVNGGAMLDSTVPQFVQFPPGIVSNYPAITVDAWAIITNPYGFLWAFGITDTNGTGGNAVWFNCQNRLTISDTDPTWGGEQNAFVPFDSLNNAGYVHITCVVDPPTHRLLVYTNGMLAAINTGETRSLTNVYSINNYIAKSLYNADGYLPVTIDEFRIWNGALNGVEVAGCDAAGPDAIGGAASVGTVTNVTVSAPYPNLVQGGHETVSVTGSATLFTNQMSIDNFLCTFSSADTNILTVNSNGVVTAIRPGTTTISASYGGMAGSMSITAFPEPVTLVHRWSFNNTDDGAGNFGAIIADAVGGTNWNGTLPAGGSFTNGQLVMQPGQYVDLPTNLFSGMTNVTFDTWTTFPTNLPWNAWFLGFGDINGTYGRYYFFVQPQSGSFCMGGGDPGWQFDGERASAGVDWSGQTIHLTCVASTGGGYLALYTNGVLAATYNNLTYPMSSIHDNYSWINQSLYSGDPQVANTINELRIYNGAMSPQQVAANDAAGPDVLGVIPPTLSATLSGGNLLVSWPLTYSGFTLKSTSSLASGPWITVGTSPVTNGADYQVTLPATNAAQFYRLSQ